MNEPALIQDAQKGNLDAFNTLILHYQDSVYNTALRILGDEDQAADAAQEAFHLRFQKHHILSRRIFQGLAHANRD